jgi:hypothetical protein
MKNQSPSFSYIIRQYVRVIYVHFNGLLVCFRNVNAHNNYKQNL